MKRRNCGSRFGDSKSVMRHLAGAARSGAKMTDPILEKLRQCPEACKAGELLGKAFDSLKYRQEDALDGDRITPPPGTIIPPFA